MSFIAIKKSFFDGLDEGRTWYMQSCPERLQLQVVAPIYIEPGGDEYYVYGWPGFSEDFARLGSTARNRNKFASDILEQKRPALDQDTRSELWALLKDEDVNGGKTHEEDIVREKNPNGTPFPGRTDFQAILKENAPNLTTPPSPELIAFDVIPSDWDRPALL